MPITCGCTPCPGPEPERQVDPACQLEPSRAAQRTPIPLVFDRICWAGSSRPVKKTVA